MKSLLNNIRIILVITLLLSVQYLSVSQNLRPAGEKLSLLFIGDIMGHDDQIKSAKDSITNTYNYENVFKYIKPVICNADLAIANFEVTLAGKPYSGYPQFSSPDEFAVACKNAGIDYLVTANNHAADRGKSGLISTINKLDSLGFPHTGTFLDAADRDSLSPLIINKNGKSIALLNYTYGTNGIKIPGPLIVNMLDKDIIAGDVRKAIRKKAEIIVLFLHWGIEYDTIPSAIQEDLAEYLFSIGVNLVIGSHPHVLQKMEWRKDPDYPHDKVVIYSLGNFVSNQRKPKTDGGAMVKIEFTFLNDSVYVSDAGYYLTWVDTPVENSHKMYYVLPCSQFENDRAHFSNPGDFLQMKKFINESRALLNSQNIMMKEYLLKHAPPETE